jgi:hypothetical protein
MLGTSMALAAAFTFATTNAMAADYAGKRITVIVPFSEGGGTDSYSRFMAPYFEKYLPGNPKILIVNRPGGGGLTGVNYFAARAENDGTSVLALSTSSISNYMLGDRRAKFEVTDFVPIILSPRGITQYVHGSLGIQHEPTLKAKIEKLRSLPRERLVFGGKTPTSGFRCRSAGRHQQQNRKAGRHKSLQHATLPIHGTIETLRNPGATLNETLNMAPCEPFHLTVRLKMPS